MAFTQSTQGEIATLYYTVSGDRILGVAGATGIKPAVVSQKRTQAGFVAVNQKNEQATH